LSPSLLGQVVKDEGFVIDDSSVPFVYEVKAEIPTPEEKLAGYLSADFANAGDEFAQHAMLTKLRPVIQKRIDAAKAAPLMVVRIGFDLPKYDFERHGFPSGLMENTFVTFNNQYILNFLTGTNSTWCRLTRPRRRPLIPPCVGDDRRPCACTEPSTRAKRSR
jgi:hypothetical protein